MQPRKCQNSWCINVFLKWWEHFDVGMKHIVLKLGHLLPPERLQMAAHSLWQPLSTSVQSCYSHIQKYKSWRQSRSAFVQLIYTAEHTHTHSHTHSYHAVSAAADSPGGEFALERWGTPPKFRVPLRSLASICRFLKGKEGVKIPTVSLLHWMIIITLDFVQLKVTKWEESDVLREQRGRPSAAWLQI